VPVELFSALARLIMRVHLRLPVKLFSALSCLVLRKDLRLPVRLWVLIDLWLLHRRLRPRVGAWHLLLDVCSIGKGLLLEIRLRLRLLLSSLLHLQLSLHLCVHLRLILLLLTSHYGLLDHTVPDATLDGLLFSLSSLEGAYETRGEGSVCLPVLALNRDHGRSSSSGDVHLFSS